MKTSEFRKLIREEITKVLKESAPKYKVGQTVDDINGDERFKIKKVYPNKQAALMDLKKTTSPEVYRQIVQDVEDMYDNYRSIDPEDDTKPWYILEPKRGAYEYPYLNPEAYVFDLNFS